MSGDWVSHSVEFLKLGVVFPTGFYDASIVLVGMQGELVNSSLDLLNWTQQFEPEVWAMCGATVLCSALVYIFLEWIGGGGDDTYSTRDGKEEQETGNNNNDSADGRDWATRLGDNLYAPHLNATTNFDYAPTTGACRIFAISVALWVLLFSSTYTASLASFYVETNSNSQTVDSIEAAIQANSALCVITGTYMENHLTRQHPNAQTVGVDTYDVGAIHGMG